MAWPNERPFFKKTVCSQEIQVRYRRKEREQKVGEA